MAGDPRVQELLEEMLDSGKSPDEVCCGCPELLAEVRERWRQFRCIDAAIVEFVPGLRTAPEVGTVPSLSPAVGLPEVPGYELLGEVGRGGMGVIHRARDLALDRHVAVKLLQDRYATDSPIGRRFTDEALITAQLQHPGVPAVYQVGTLPDSRPFLAMKLIKGRTLAALLGERPDPAADQGSFVAIFEQVCQAVAYAHSLRVIHRDLKPSNVMVGKFGEVQIMDWGLAKVLPAGAPIDDGPRREWSPADDGTVIRAGPAGAADTPGGSGNGAPPTRDGSVLGTPAYMAPEQAGGELDRLDERADVFGLGVVLCEVLTGSPPYTGRDEYQVFRKALRSDLADAHSRLSDSSAEPELVALCRRCLSAEPEERARHAGDVAHAVAALRAAAEGRARRAELDRVWAAEQGKRRRVLLTASGVIAVVMLAGLGVSVWQTLRAMQAEAAATTSAEQARLNAEEAEGNARHAQTERDAKAAALAAEQQARRDETKARQQAFDALRSMTAEVVERKFAQGAVLTEDDRQFLRGVIAQFDAFAEIKGEDADSRAVRAEGRYRVGTIRYRLGELREALENYDQALSIYRQLSADFRSRSEFRQNLARSYIGRGVLLYATGRPQEAEQDHDRALNIQKQLAAEFPSRPEFRRSLAVSLNNLGNLLRDAGRPHEAEQDHDQALGIQRQLAADFPARPEFRDELAVSHCNRGLLLSETGRLNGAEEDFDRALSIQKKLAADFPARPEFRDDLAVSLHGRGRLLLLTGRLRESEEDHDRALDIRKQLAADFPSRPEFRLKLAKSYIGRGALLSSTDRLEEAEQDYDRALSLLKQLLTDFPSRSDIREDLATIYKNRANLLRDAGRLKEAEREYDLALGIRRQLAADIPNQPDLRIELATTCRNLALLRQRQGDWAAAKQLLLEGRPHLQAALKANLRHPIYRQHYLNHLIVLTTAHAGLLEREDAVRTAETCRDFKQSRPYRRRVYRPYPSGLLRIRNNLANLQFTAGVAYRIGGQRLLLHRRHGIH
jgi:serine/threonine protein kinase/tetratricopeptide (TPR) repeat protein